jgi:membrane fusion protein (multidrug efflux system)
VLRWRLIVVLVSVGVLLAVLIGLNFFVKPYFIHRALTQNASPPQSVSTITAGYSEWQPEITAVGSLRAVHGVDVTTEVAGLVRSIKFRSGDEVQAGQVLIELNADADIAQLRALQAAADLSATTNERDKVQYEAEAISKAQLDSDAADLKAKRATAASQAALVAKKSLRAPFAGRLGITTVNPGQYLNPGDKVVTLQSIDPIFIDFMLPQQQLSRIVVGQPVKVTTDAFPKQTFSGQISATDPRVDTGTRNFQAEALIDNQERRLLPGMFGRVAVEAGKQERYLTLPQTAITYNPYGATVFLAVRNGDPPAGKDAAKDAFIAQQTFVTTGATRGDQVAVLSGIHEGDIIVTSGQLKLKNGTVLVIDNRVQPRDDPHPAPQEQ